MDNLVSAYFLGLFPSSSLNCHTKALATLSKCCLYAPTLGSLLKPFFLLKCTFIPVSMLRPIRGLLSQREKMTSFIEASQTPSSVRINLSPSCDPHSLYHWDTLHTEGSHASLCPLGRTFRAQGQNISLNPSVLAWCFIHLYGNDTQQRDETKPIRSAIKKNNLNSHRLTKWPFECWWISDKEGKETESCTITTAMRQ